MESEIDNRLDRIYDLIDSNAKEGDFEFIDSVLRFNVDIKEHNVDILLGYLTATLNMKSELNFREKLYNHTKEISEEQNLEQDLLKGLE